MKQISKKQIVNQFGFSVGASKEQSSSAARREYIILKTLLSSKDRESRSIVIDLVDYIEDTDDIWMILEKGGSSISRLVFKLKGEFHNGQRIYSIKKGYFLKFLFDDLNNLRALIRKMLIFINFLNQNGIIHCDIKPENILIEFDPNDLKKDSAYSNLIFSKMKVIDYGSAFFIDSPENFSSNTPEYMCPEINELLERKTSASNIIAFLKNLKSTPWCIDMWSLGVSILEMALACPIWISYKAKVTLYDKVIYKTGLFGFNGRDNNKILNKQLEVSQSVGKLLEDSLVQNETDRELLSDLLSKMLDINYKTRISPLKALEHPFLKLKK